VTFISTQGIAILADATDHAQSAGLTFSVIGCTAWTARMIAMWRSLSDAEIRCGATTASSPKNPVRHR